MGGCDVVADRRAAGRRGGGHRLDRTDDERGAASPATGEPGGVDAATPDLREETWVDLPGRVRIA
ncbi:hypothetical protein IU11_08090 [Cellulosimicrobium sp. MM]|nr:hypothetical protein IU11_08090 [Cellulosimicrobium sp. MM]